MFCLVVQFSRDELEKKCTEIQTEAETKIQKQEEEMQELVSLWDREGLCRRVDKLLEYLKSDDIWKPADITVWLSEAKDSTVRREQAFLGWLQRFLRLITTGLNACSLQNWMEGFNADVVNWKEEDKRLIDRCVRLSQIF